MDRGRDDLRLSGPAQPADHRQRFAFALTAADGQPIVVLMLAAIPIQRAIGTSLVIICVNSLAGLAGHVGKLKIDWAVVLGFALAALAGMAAGFRLGKRFASSSLQRAFAWSIILLGALVITWNVAQITR